MFFSVYYTFPAEGSQTVMEEHWETFLQARCSRGGNTLPFAWQWLCL